MNFSGDKGKARQDIRLGLPVPEGLGSNCAVALARIGIGRLIIADFDVVTESNLNRQYYFCDQVGMKKVEALKDNLIRINPKDIYRGLRGKAQSMTISRFFLRIAILSWRHLTWLIRKRCSFHSPYKDA